MATTFKRFYDVHVRTVRCAVVRVLAESASEAEDAARKNQGCEIEAETTVRELNPDMFTERVPGTEIREPGEICKCLAR
jgi:hypothetical protein